MKNPSQKDRPVHSKDIYFFDKVLLLLSVLYFAGTGLALWTETKIASICCFFGALTFLFVIVAADKKITAYTGKKAIRLVK